MLKRCWIALWLFAVACHASAGDVVVAQVSPRTGPLGPNGIANYEGAKAYFDQINGQGGINGQRIRFVYEDDNYKPEETVRLLRLVAKRDNPALFVNLLGSANVSTVLKDKVLEEIAVPVVGVTPGSEAVRTPGSPWLCHVHAGDRAQIRRIISHLATLGIKRIAVASQDIPFGRAGVSFVDDMASSLKLEVAAKVAVKPAEEDLKSVALQLRASGAQSYVMILVPNSGASLVRDTRAIGDRSPIYSLSYVTVKDIVAKSSVEDAVGVAIAQVTPNPFTRATGLTRDFHNTMDKFAPAGTDHSQHHLVGYLSARVAVEALRRAGGAPTPARTVSVLRTLRTDLAGYVVNFTENSTNVGSQFVDIGVIDRNGRLMY